MRTGLALLTAAGVVLALSGAAGASTVLGTGSGALLGSDLSDPDNNINDNVSGNPPYFGTGYDWSAAFANDENYFSPGGPSNEAALDLFDNKVGSGEAKWYNPGENAWLSLQFSQQYRLTHFTMASGNDSTGRDPDIFHIQGSNDSTDGQDGTWTDIFFYNNDGTSPWGNTRNQVILWESPEGPNSPAPGSEDFAIPAPYSWFRFDADSVRSGNQLQLCEIEYFGIYVPPTTPGATLFWDGSAGNWTANIWLLDVPPGGAASGTYPQNIANVVNPANITEGTVTVNSNEEAFSLLMDTGTAGSGGRPGNGILNITSNTLSINTDATISNTSAVNISPGATLDVMGILTIDPTATFNNSGTANAGTLAGTGTATLNLNSKLKAGGGTLGAITLTGDAEVEVGGTVTIGQLNLPAGTTVTKSGAGTLDVTGATTLLTGQLYRPTAGTLELSGVVSGSVDLVKEGAGILQLSNNNSYTGLTTVNDGVVSISNAGALGGTAAGTVVNAGGSLRLTGGNFNISEPLTLNGGGAALSDGALHSAVNNHDINGLVTLGSNATIRKDGGGDMEFRGGGGGGINTAGFELRIEAANTIRIYDNGLSGSGTLRKEESGTLEIRTSNAGFTGATIINDGYVDVNQTNGLGTGQITAQGDGTLRIRDGITLANNIGISTDGEGTAGAIRNENNTNTITGTVTSTNNNSRIHVNSVQLNLTNTLALNNNVNIYGNGTLNVTGQVTGGGALNKNDGGTTILANAANSFTGPLNVGGGTVNVTSAGALGGPKDATVASGATLNLAGGALNNFVVNGDATTSANLAVTNLTVTSSSLQAGANLVTVSGGMQLVDASYTATTGSFQASGTIDRSKPETLILGGGVVTVASNRGKIFTADVGNPGQAGTFAEGPAGTYTIEGGGGDIWGNSDQFFYAYQQFSGDGEMIARVADPENTNTWAKAGLMVRETLDGNSKNVFVARTPTTGEDRITFQRRESTGGGSASEHTNNFFDPYYWLKIERQGNTYRGYWAPDVSGSPGTWSQRGSDRTFTMNSDVYLGMAVTAHNNGTLCTTVFDNVTGFVLGDFPTELENLTGDGTIVGDISVVGTLAPGGSTGRIDVIGDLILGEGIVIDWEYANGAADRDLVTITGDLELPLTATLNVFNLLGTGTLQPTEILFDAGSLSGATDLSGWTLTGAPESSVAIQGDDVILSTQSDIPEPATIAMLALALAGMGGYVRRRRRA